MRYFQEMQGTDLDSDAAPTRTDSNGNYHGAPLGLPLPGLRAYRLTVAAPQGQSMDGVTVTILAWLFNTALGEWARFPSHDVVLDIANATSSADTQSRVVDREILVDGASILYFNRFNLAFAGTATEPSEEDHLLVRIEGVFRKE